MNPQHSQNGAALVVSLVLLLVATITTVASMHGSHLQERMTSNQNNKAISLMAAEAGASQVLSWIRDPDNNFDVKAITKQLEDEFGSEAQIDGGFNANTQGYFSITVDSANEWIDIIGVARIGQHEPALSRTTIRMGYEASFSDGGGIPPAPAAISCLGGACDLRSGASANHRVDGRNHDLPPNNCSGSSCWENPMLGGSMMPSVYLDDPANSSVSRQGGGPNPPYCGVSHSSPDPENPTSVCGATESAHSVWNASHYSDNEEGESTHPKVDAYFGTGTPIGDTTPGGNHSWGSRDDPAVTYFHPNNTPDLPGNANVSGVLIIDGDYIAEMNGYTRPSNYDPNHPYYDPDNREYTRKGTGVFIGLVVIRNCGHISLGGNFNVYGAIIVDASGCETPYDPYNGGGNPSVRYSGDALDAAGVALGGGVGFGLTRWLEVTP